MRLWHSIATGGDLPSMTVPRPRSDELAVLLIDIQEFFLDGWMAGLSEPLLTRSEFLLGLANVYALPTMYTLEHPVGEKGELAARLVPFLPLDAQRHVKRTFDCCGEPGIVAALAGLKRRQIAVAGGETDVCVLQSVLGLIERGYEVFLLEDCLFSSEANVGPAIRRMEMAGAIPTTVKTLNYELRATVGERGAEELLSLIRPGLSIPEPERLPVVPA